MALPQPLHIFRKDLTHLWPETLFVLALFAVFGYAAPSAWANSEYLVYITVLSLPLKLLMVVSWLVLIARAIQDESLVGDRQFWTSRPYHWANLLAAKAILIVTCIYLPFFLMQCYLLHHTGLHPMLVIPALLHNLLLLTVSVIIPLAAISAVTSTFPRVLLTFIATAIVILILGGIILYRVFLQMHPPNFWWVVYTILIVFPAVALVVQYKTRKTLISRLILVATPLLAMLFILLNPNDSLIGHSYPVATGPTLAGMSDQMPPRPITGQPTTFRGYVMVSLPVAVSNVDKDTIYKADGVQTTITAPGVSYTSPYMSAALVFQDQISGGRPFAPITFLVREDVFNKIHDQPVDLQVKMASDQYKLEKPSTWNATLLPFSVPGNGMCSFPSNTGSFTARLSNGYPVCHYPLEQPEISFVSAPLAARSCETPAAPPLEGQANVGGGSATLDFDPVVTVPLRFQTADPNPQHNYVLCPGTPLTFVDAQTLPRASVVFEQKHVVLDPFVERFTPQTNGKAPQQADPE